MSDLHIDALGALVNILKELYGFRIIADLQPITGGYITQNFSFSNGQTVFFLKRYNTTETSRIRTITVAHQRLMDEGIPIIAPLPAANRETMFFLDDAWWGVFPFVQGRTFRSVELNAGVASELGAMLGRIHCLGQRCRTDDIEPLSAWNTEVFNSDRLTLEYVYKHLPVEREVDRLAIGNIRLQAEFLASQPKMEHAMSIPNNCLIHGDFTHNNVFFDEAGRVKWIYDLDKACVAPRAYELVRSLLITCFDHGWDAKSFALADAFLRTYLKVCPMEFSEFERGFRMYVTHFMHMTWLEKKILLSHSSHHEPFIFTSHRRLEHLIEDFDTLARRLYPTS